MTGKGARSLGRGELEPLADLIGQLGLTGHFAGDAVIHGNDPVIRSAHRLGEASCTRPTTSGTPKFSPVFYLADLVTGYFAAAGMMAALHRRAIEGGSYQVKLSLARSAMWVQELGPPDAAAHVHPPDPAGRRPPRALRRGPRVMAIGDFMSGLRPGGPSASVDADVNV